MFSIYQVFVAIFSTIVFFFVLLMLN